MHPVIELKYSQEVYIMSGGQDVYDGAGLILSVETNTFVESIKQNVEFKKRICGVHEIV